MNDYKRNRHGRLVLRIQAMSTLSPFSIASPSVGYELTPLALHFHTACPRETNPKHSQP